MSYEDPIAFFFTWSTYGTWLPGDARGWVEYRKGFRLPDPVRELEAKAKMTEDSCLLSPDQRREVEWQITETCRRRGWTLHAVNCRSNHVHAVTSASRTPRFMRQHLKSWCTRRLSEHEQEQGVSIDQLRENWWADRGSVRWVYGDEGLLNVTHYVVDEQDNRDRFRQPEA